MKAIGGYFPLELSERDGFPHDRAFLLNSGRHAFELALQAYPSLKRVHIPFYTCDVILEPLKRLGIEFAFYAVNEQLEIASLPQVGEHELLLYTNYFGVKDAYVRDLASFMGEKLVVDHSQALFTEAGGRCFYSPRKFAGVPDGGIAVTPDEEAAYLYERLERDHSRQRCSHLLTCLEASPEEGYAAFQENSSLLSSYPMRKMSVLTQRLLCSVDWEGMKRKRNANFQRLDQCLSPWNRLPLQRGSFACPMVYPLWVKGGEALRQWLISRHIFVARYWPHIPAACAVGSQEYQFAYDLLPLPIDQRYDAQDMERMLELIGESGLLGNPGA